MSEIVILGGSGFIGQNLIKSLDSSVNISLRNESWAVGIHKDVKVMINLVGKAHDHKDQASKEDYYYANLELTKQVFNVFNESEARLLLHVSSIAAIEEVKTTTPLVETNKCNPTSFYGESKRAAEIWLLKQELKLNKKLIIIRPPMVHGPGDKGNLGLLYKVITKGIPYPLESFNNRRSFISIENLCYFIKQIINNQHGLKSGIYHVADDESVSTKEIIDIIKLISNKKTPNLAVPKILIRSIAKLGDIVPLPLNTKRLKKMTSDLLVSNKKIKLALGIDQLPLTAKQGLQVTIQSFIKNNYQ